MDIQFLDRYINRYIEALDPDTIAKVDRTLTLLETFGHLLGMPHSKPILNGLFELRIFGKKNLRLFYTFHKGRAWILHVYTKKGRKLPKRELYKALANLRRLI
jgi:phage-related protein